MDTFRVIGTVNKVPVICGDNNGQHSKTLIISNQPKVIVEISSKVYLFVPPTPTLVQLSMSFGSSNFFRFWKIKIGLLPCDTNDGDYLGI